MDSTRDSWLWVAWRANSATEASAAAGAWRQINATWSSLSSPASKAARVSGSSGRRRAMDTSRQARLADTPHFQPTQWAGDRMSAPSHEPVASTSAIKDTNRPAVALATPHTWATSASRRIASTSHSVAVLITSLYRTLVPQRKSFRSFSR